MTWTSLTRTAPPAVMPVTLAEAKAHLRISGTDQDTLILGLIESAVSAVEGQTNRAICEQTWRMCLDDFPRGYGHHRHIRIPKPPTVEISGITYTDTGGATQTLATDQYVLHKDDFTPFVCEAYGVTWPSVRCVPGAVTINFKAGYQRSGPLASTAVPPAIKQAILLHVQSTFDNLRPDEAEAVNTTIARLVRPLRVAVL